MTIKSLKRLQHLPVFKWNFSSKLCFSQTLLKEWSTRASFWMEITVAPFFTLETTRTRALVTLIYVVLRVSALHLIYNWTSYRLACKTVQFLYWRLLGFHHPLGITFSFFWKNHESASRFAVASGGKVISNGFSVYTNPLGGYVEFYTRSNKHRWRANIDVPGTPNTFPFT